MRNISFLNRVGALLLAAILAGCAAPPKVPYSADFDAASELAEGPGISRDDRGRFREILCAVLEDGGEEFPDYMPCEDVLTSVGEEPPATGRPVDRGPTQAEFLVGIVPGLGWECFANWLDYQDYGPNHVSRFGYESTLINVDGLSSTKNNASQINDFITALPPSDDGRPLILIGYSKGAPDVLDFVVSYPEAAQRVAAVVAFAGAIGGSSLALESSQDDARLLTKVPGSECDEGDEGAVEDLRPDVRKQWLAEHTLPGHIRYYSVVTFPDPESRISFGLKSSYRKLAALDDGRNDSQLVFRDQVIPGSTLVAFANADHWAMAVPVSRSHAFVGNTFVNRNDYPREAFFEALLRYIEEDLSE